jgi:hypothetical protein
MNRDKPGNYFLSLPILINKKNKLQDARLRL